MSETERDDEPTQETKLPVKCQKCQKHHCECCVFCDGPCRGAQGHE